QLTGGVAHDFNNLLTVARGNIELLELRIGNDDKARANIAATLRAIDHGAALTQQLLSYARKQALSPSTVDVAKTLEHFGTFLRSVIRENISIAVDASEGLPAIQADQAQLEAALLNLALNAQDAMPGGGILTISASKAIGATDRVDIAVSDNGTGIAEALRDKVLEPFFTTKDVGQGSGLGLSMVYGFVKQSGGDFDLESTPGAGTTVTLSMPLATVGPALEHEDEGSATVQKGKGRVLLVEDNPELRDLAEGMLDSLGYVVDSAADARDATRHLQDCGDYDILFTDLVLPGDVSGLQLAEWATASHPTMRIVITSGYADNVLREGGGLPPHVQFLPKPYQLATISQVLNDELLLDQR
ncbi:MAG: response regulator, partial [Alphaproteobacteria bacterium]|nr:response regulator [Alphaproteobacteria bacterium]